MRNSNNGVQQCNKLKLEQRKINTDQNLFTVSEIVTKHNRHKRGARPALSLVHNTIRINRIIPMKYQNADVLWEAEIFNRALRWMHSLCVGGWWAVACGTGTIEWIGDSDALHCTANSIKL